MPPLWPLLFLLALGGGLAGGEAFRRPEVWRPAPRTLWRLPPGQPMAQAAPMSVFPTTNEAAKTNTPPAAPESAQDSASSTVLEPAESVAAETPKAAPFIPDPIPEEAAVAGPWPWEAALKHPDRFNENANAIIPAMPMADPDHSAALEVDLKDNPEPVPEEEAVAAPCDFCVPGRVFADPMPMAPNPDLPARESAPPPRVASPRPAPRLPDREAAYVPPDKRPECLALNRRFALEEMTPAAKDELRARIKAVCVRPW